LYLFDSNVNSLVLIGVAPVSAIIQGTVVDPDGELFVALTNHVGTPSILMNPTAPESNPAGNVTKPSHNVRLYEIDKHCVKNPTSGCNALEYSSSSMVDGMRCWNGAFSPDGKLFAYSCQSGPSANTIPAAVPSVFSPTVNVPAPGVLTVVKIEHHNRFGVQNSISTAVLPISHEWSPDGTRLFVGGAGNANVGEAHLVELVDN
jgi:hypothetical protein